MRIAIVLTLLLALAPCPSVRAQSPAASPEAVFDALWETFDTGYALFPAKSIDWHKLHEIYRPRIVADMTEEELFVVLTDMLSHLNDNHVILLAPSLGRDFSAGYIAPYIEKMGFEGALAFLEQHPLPGRYFRESPRTLENGVFQYGWIDRDVGYIHLVGFKGSVDNAAAMDSILKDLSSARALVVDVRHNSGGHDRVGKIIADRFADRRRLYMVTRDRSGPGHGDFREPRYWHVDPAARTFTGPVILLANRFSVSAAENFVLAMRVLPHVTVAGDFTSGCFADMAWFDLPNGWRCSYSRNLFVDHAGRCWEGIGVPPDIMIRGSEPDGENDPAFEFALALLRDGGPAPQDESASAAAARVSLVEILSRELEKAAYTDAYESYERIRGGLDPAVCYLSARELNALGYRLISLDRLEDAIRVFELYTEHYPEDANAHDSLGEAYMLAGDNERATAGYRRSLELDPENENAAKMLSKLNTPGPAAVDTLVLVDGFSLNFRIFEGGSPAILLEAGGGMDLTAWDAVAPELAARTGATVICYDRAGFGKSDLPDRPCDMRIEAGWLWQSLRHLGYDEDIILVGHSYGGWMIRIEASERPEAVRGMVFVDPFSVELVDRLGIEYLDRHPMSGKLPFDTSHPEMLSKQQRALARMVGEGLAPKVAIMRETAVPRGIPVFIIKSALRFLPKEEEQRAWSVALDEMAGSIEGSKLIVAEKSDHMIPFRQPELVIEAVAKTIRLAGFE